MPQAEDKWNGLPRKEWIESQNLKAGVIRLFGITFLGRKRSVQIELIETHHKKLYKCDVCDKVENWNDDWQWFGSYRDEEDGEPLLYICSLNCRGNMTEFAATNLLKQKQKATEQN